jgi:hypothetical protein
MGAPSVAEAWGRMASHCSDKGLKLSGLGFHRLWQEIPAATPKLNVEVCAPRLCRGGYPAFGSQVVVARRCLVP